MKVYQLFLFSIFLLAISIYSSTDFFQNKKCKKFICSEDLSDGTCLAYNLEDDTINLKKCSKSESEICPIMVPSQLNKLKCEAKSSLQNQKKSFPGGNCNMNDDCIYGDCINNFCKGKALDEQCDGHNQCPFNSGCKLNSDSNTKTCTLLSNEEDICTDDFDCLNNLGCHMGKCINYLSLPLGTKVGTSIRNVFPLCESGYAYDGVCESLQNHEESLHTNCGIENQKSCKYIRSNGEEVIIENLCLCGKNPEGDRFCALGNNSNEWNDYLKSLKKVLAFNYEYCNTLERTMCRNSIEKSMIEYKIFMKDFVYATKQHELFGADSCVFDIFYPMLNTKNRKTLEDKIKSNFLISKKNLSNAKNKKFNFNKPMLKKNLKY